MPHRARKFAVDLDAMSWDEILDLRFRELPVTLEGSRVMNLIERLGEELHARQIEVRPHVWLSNEWFSPDGIPGIAIPFYLAHDRLRQLEKRQMLEVEGGSDKACMRILRHEMGHVVDTAFRLHFKKRWRETFGSFAARYPDSYKPKPTSRDYVLHFDGWYAQAHPAEDFAETFAVWLDPNSRWKSRYQGWPALRKLQAVDAMMYEIAGKKPLVTRRRQVEPLSQLPMTLREHYRLKRLHYADEWPEFYDRDLRRIFTSDSSAQGCPTAASFLRKHRPALRKIVSDWSGLYQYTIDQVLQDMIDRCRELKLRLVIPEEEARQQMMMMLTVQTMNFVHSGNYRVAL